MIYIRCPHCGRRIERGADCPCNFKREYSKTPPGRERYHGTRWQKTRAVVLALHNGLDAYALAHGRIEQADTVHHIIPSDECPDKFYDLDNLIPVSRHSHDEIHTIYRESEEARARLVSELQSLTKSLS